MAKLTPENTDTQIVDNTRAPGSVKADTSLATLFEGASDLFNTAVKGVDKMFQTRATEEAEEAAREIRTLTTATAMAENDVMGKLPPEAMQGVNRLGRAREAMLSGRVTYSHYYGMLDAESRRLRSRYPGYKDWIDNAFSKITGVDPANALLRSIMAENEALAQERKNKGDKEKDWGKSIADLISKGDVPLPLIEKFEKGTLPVSQATYTQMSIAQGRAKATKRVEEEEVGKMKRAAEKMQLNSDFAQNKVMAMFNRRDEEITNEIISKSFPGGLEAFEQTLKTGGANIKPADMQAYVQAVAGITNARKQLVEDILKEKRVSNSGEETTFANILGPEGEKIFKQRAYARIDAEMAPFTGGDPDAFKVLGRNRALVKAYAEAGQLELITQNKIARNAMVWRGIGGDYAFQTYMNNVFENPADKVKFFSGLSILETAENNHGERLGVGQSFWKTVDNKVAKDGATSKGSIVKEAITTFNRMMADPKVPPDIKTSLIRGFFNEDGIRELSKLGSGDRMKLYTTLTSSPATAAHLHTLKQADPTSYKRAMSWVGNMFIASTTPSLNVFAEGLKQGSFKDIKWDKKLGQFQVSYPDPNSVSPLASLRAGHIRDFNQALNNYKPFLASQGIRTEEHILEYLRDIGVQQDKTKFEKTILKAMIDAMPKENLPTIVEFETPTVETDNSAPPSLDIAAP